MLPQRHAELGDAIRPDFTPTWVGWATCCRKVTPSYLSDAPGNSSRAPASNVAIPRFELCRIRVDRKFSFQFSQFSQLNLTD